MKFILASSSSSRKNLLSIIGFKPDICLAADIDETPKKKEKPRLLALRLAQEKNELIRVKYKDIIEKYHDNVVVLSGDTVISVGSRIIDKALTDEDVRTNMKMISGRNNVGYSAFCAYKISKEGNILQKTIKVGMTRVKMKHLSSLDIEEIIKSKSGIGVAGGYTIDGFAGSFIISATGTHHSNIIGMPLYFVRNTLMTMGLKSSFSS